MNVNHKKYIYCIQKWMMYIKNNSIVNKGRNPCSLEE